MANKNGRFLVSFILVGLGQLSSSSSSHCEPFNHNELFLRSSSFTRRDKRSAGVLFSRHMLRLLGIAKHLYFTHSSY